MVSPEDTKLGHALAANIAMLATLNQKPMPPPINLESPSQDQLTKDGNGRTLSFENERQLTGMLAFLSGVSGDSKDVMAVCVEETSGQTVRMLVAANRNSAVSPVVCKKAIDGFRSVLAVLERKGPVDDVLGAVVAMSRERILQRLRSRKAPFCLKAQGKPFLGSTLKKVIEDLEEKTATLLIGSILELDDVIQNAKVFSSLLHSIEHNPSYPSVADIVQVVNKASLLVKSARSAEVVRHLHLTEELVSRLTKLACYDDSARYLFRLARHWPGLRRMTVEQVPLDKTAFSKTCEMPTHCPNLAASLRSIDVAEPKRVNSALGKKSTAFSTNLKSAVSKSKVHAEMQLLCYYEMERVPMPPRVIRSNKDTCYMCHAFFAVHRKFHLTRSHGKIYPGWRVPYHQAVTSQLPALNRMLVARIQEEARNLLQPSLRRAGLGGSSESTVPSMASLRVSDLISEATLSSRSRAGNGPDTIMYAPHCSTNVSGELLETVEEVSEARSSTQASNLSTDCHGVYETRLQKNASGKKEGSSTRQNLRLARGESQTVALDGSSTYHSVSTPFMILYLEFVASRTELASRTRTEITVTWLSTADARDLKSEDILMFDASSLSDLEEVFSKKQGPCYLAHRGEIVRVKFEDKP